MDQIEYAEYLIQQDRRSRGKIANPAGFIIWSIENNLSVPVEFETARKRRFREAQEQDAGEQRFRTLQLENEYDEFCQEQISKRLASEYPTERLEVAIREQLKVIKREQPEWFGRIPEGTRRELALGRLKAMVRDSLDLPNFDHWSKRDLQQRLF
jgi:hypothetical protein